MVLKRSTAVARATALAVTVASTAAGALDLPDDTYRALPCRPTIACTADIVPPGVLEIETGYLFRRVGVAGMQHSTPTLFKLTVAHWLQAQVGGNGAVFASGDVPASYLDDVTAGLKVHFNDQGTWAPSLALSATVSVPTFAPQRGYLPTTDLLFTAYATRDIGWLHVDLNAGLNVWRLEGPALYQPFVALALSTALTDLVGVMVEGYVFGDAAPVAPRDAGVLAAVALSPRTWLTFDLGGDVGLYPASRAYSLFAGVTVIPADLWDTDREARVREAERLRLRDIRAR